MRAPREFFLLAAMLLLVAVAAAAVSPSSSAKKPETLSSHSPAPGDARALYLWLETLEYRTARLEYRAFAPDETVSAVLILSPTVEPSEDELSALRRWVERGGTVVLAGEQSMLGAELPRGFGQPVDRALGAFLRAFGMTARAFGAPQEQVSPAQPLLANPPVRKAKVQTDNYLAGPPELVRLLGDSERPVAVRLAVGRGQVFALTSRYAFSNQGLGEADNAALLLNWLPAASSGTVLFDEVHHGLAVEQTLTSAIARQPWGWALLWGLALGYVFLILRGRRFGRALEVATDGRRVAEEYVISVAGLLRRGRKVAWLAGHYDRKLRRQLAATFGIDPSLGPAALASRLSEAGPTNFDARTVERVLAELQAGQAGGVNEGRLVKIAAQADEVIEACSRRKP